jgi:hypothetical protein
MCSYCRYYRARQFLLRGPIRKPATDLIRADFRGSQTRRKADPYGSVAVRQVQVPHPLRSFAFFCKGSGLSATSFTGVYESPSRPQSRSPRSQRTACRRTQTSRMSQPWLACCVKYRASAHGHSLGSRNGTSARAELEHPNCVRAVESHLCTQRWGTRCFLCIHKQKTEERSHRSSVD